MGLSFIGEISIIIAISSAIDNLVTVYRSLALELFPDGDTGGASYYRSLFVQGRYGSPFPVEITLTSEDVHIVPALVSSTCQQLQSSSITARFMSSTAA